MAIRLADGSIRLNDGRILYANSLILAQDLVEVIALFSPPPVWPFVSGGGGGAGPQGPAGPAGSGGGGAGFQGAQGGFGPQGFQGTNPGPQGDVGPQGNQGVAGVGTQGNQGAFGPQGNQGTAGAQGNQGVAGTGTQGPQGNVGVQGLLGPQGFQGLLSPDIFAATRVVSLIPGDGTDLTIASALAALPAEGGLILVKQGTYPVAATMTMPLKPVSIFGSGAGTIIDLGANAIAAFTVPTGYASNTPLVFKNMQVIGTEVAGQTFLSYGESNSLAEIYIENLKTVGVEITINITASSQGGATPGQDDARFHLLRCRIRPCATNNSVILTNSSFGYPRTWMTEVEFIGDSLFAIPGGRSAPLFGRIADDTYFGDCYLDSCEMSVGTGEEDFATFETINSIVWNNDNVNTSVDFFLNGNFAGFAAGTLRDSSFRGIHFSSFENTNYISNWLQNCPLELYGADTVVGDNQIIQSGTWPGPAFMIQTNDENMIIRNNRIRASTPPAFVIDIEAPVKVIGNDFSEVHPPAGNGTLFIDNNDCIILGNEFTFAPTTGPNVNEVNGPNMYDDNIRLFTNKTGGGPIIDPIIPVGHGSTVQGTVDFNGAASVGGTATNSLVVWYRNPFGLSKVQGYIENTGANAITVREQYISQNEGTFTRTTVLAPTAKLILDPYNFTGFVGLDNQVVDYRVDVSGTAISWHTYFPAINGVVAT